VVLAGTSAAPDSEALRFTVEVDIEDIGDIDVELQPARAMAAAMKLARRTLDRMFMQVSVEAAAAPGWTFRAAVEQGGWSSGSAY
jgi:hypothetical protein